MKQLHVFGDSFVESSSDSSWVTRLANLLSMKLNGHGLGGSGIEYSYLKLLDNIPNIGSGDVVVFAITNPFRWDLEPYLTQDPSRASTVTDLDSPNCNLDDIDYLKWYLMARSTKLLDSKATLYIAFIHSLSIKFPNVKFIVMSSFKESLASSLAQNSNNFMHLNRVSLNELSNHEWDLLKCPGKMFHDIYGVDPRINHMTNPNLAQLASVLHRAITTWNSLEFTKDNFLKNVVNQLVTTHEETILHYVNTNLITNSTVIRKPRN